MRCPTLSQLPPPPPDKTGWPWTEESPQLLDTMPDGQPWPLVSIVTPSYNQAQFIEETIRSVLLQGYPNLEYIIIDGGSTDGSVDIIRKYEPWLAYWVSEKDAGQADAINKGWQRSSGEILAWLNSDDVYNREAIVSAVQFLVENPAVDMVYSDCYAIDEASRVLGPMEGVRDFDVGLLMQAANHIPQPTVFFRRRVLDRVGMLDDSLRYVMDYDFWLRVGLKCTVRRIPGILANFRMHGASKSEAESYRFWPEMLYALQKAYSTPGLAPELARLRPIAFSRAHLHVADYEYRYGRLRRAWAHYRWAVYYRPRHLLEPSVFRWVGKLVVGKRTATAIKSFLHDRLHPEKASL